MRLSVLFTSVLSQLSVCSALRWPQAGSPLNPNFSPKGNSVSSGAVKIQDVLGNRFDGFSRVARRDLFGRACGSANLAICPNDPTECCEVGGVCCGQSRCCPAGNECQTNNQGNVVCCVKGNNCSTLVPMVCIRLPIQDPKGARR